MVVVKSRVIAVAFSAMLLTTVAVRAASVTLTGPARISDQVQFALNGESNRIYIIQASTNLLNWRGVLTNNEAGAVRQISINAAEPRAYYRAVTARPIFDFAVAASGQ